MARVRDQLTAKIASWRYAPEALKTREEVKAEEKAAAEERKAIKKFQANWKGLWKKVAEAMQKLVNTRLLLEGKATSINEKRETSKMDLEIADLINAEKAKNAKPSAGSATADLLA